ncbi:hypothetical protein [Azonexus sp.]|uniref:hypothetical protein n=1 Tax=Azonexus sp. TaxID=1872668 RepID=UPI0035B4E394
MGSFSLFHWSVFFPFILAAIFFARVLPKAGFSSWWALLALVPVGNIIALWIFAFTEWPAFPERQ